LGRLSVFEGIIAKIAGGTKFWRPFAEIEQTRERDRGFNIVPFYFEQVQRFAGRLAAADLTPHSHGTVHLVLPAGKLQRSRQEFIRLQSHQGSRH
jgi:hypothetical protein